MIFDKLTKEENKIVFIYTTCSSREEAKSIGFSVVEDRLAVCADFWPIDSIYPWQNVIEEVGQYMLVLTTEKSLAEKVVKFVEGLHSYEIPFITVCDTFMSNTSYKNWVKGTIEDTAEYISEYEKKKKDKDEAEGVYQYGRLK
jgi:periplasmic divalent cation tolerance protein